MNASLFSPFQGQTDAHVTLQAVAPNDAEFYVALRGSKLAHVTRAKRGQDELDLRFTVPGHDLAEVVSVAAYVYADAQVKRCGNESSLEYVRDVAQEAAEHLRANRERLAPQSYLEVLKRFSASEKGSEEEPPAGLLDSGEEDVEMRRSTRDEGGFRQLDEKITQAMANMEYPPQWNNQPSKVRDPQPKETLLHLTVRLGLVHLSRFLIHQPRGQRALTLPNQEGDTPLQLAQRDGEHAMFRVLTAPPGPVVGPVPGVWCVWSDGARMLRFCPGTDLLTLTVRQAAGSCPEHDIMVLRDRLGDHSVLKLIKVLRAVRDVDKNGHPRCDEGVCKELRAEEHVLVDSVFEEQLVLSLDDEEEDDEDERPSSVSVNEHPMQSGGAPNQFSQYAADRLFSMISGHTQADGATCSVGGVTQDSTGTDGNPWDAEDLLAATDTPPPCSEDSGPPPSSVPRSPADRAPAGLGCPAAGDRDSPPMDACDLSPSLVALEVDSEDEDAEPKPPPSALSPGVEENGRKGESFCPAPELPCTRSQSASSACDVIAKESDDQGIRLRSYSYSSPKISFRPARFIRDSQPSDISPEQRALSMSEQSHEKRIEEEELDKYNIPAKVESDKYKVIRTFSFLKSRMSSTRNKTKGKGKDRETKDRQPNGHRFATGSCLGPTVCVVCDKPASGKDLLHCSGCTAIVHKGCKDSVPPCLKKLQDKYSVSMVKNRTASLPQNFTVRDSPQCVIPISSSLPAMTPKESPTFPSMEGRPGESSETELDASKVTCPSEELQPTPVSSTSTESSFGEDCVDAYIHGDISADAVDYEAESWSLTVEHKFCKKQDKRAVKRQDVIYELMQTEVHHLQTLHIMAEVFRRGMKEEVQLDADAVERVFPCLDQLLLFHHAFFAVLKERRHSSAQPQGHRNYLIQQIGDVLVQQFSEDNGEKMKQVYGEFCSSHTEAVSFFKELQQHNKRFQNFIKQQGSNLLVRRREIPACILLVTQRITKYPVLLERILQHTEEETEEHGNLTKALSDIREVIAAVNLRVSEYEQQQRLQEVWGRMENRSTAKLKNGHTFRKQDMMGVGQTLKHQGLLLWKTATGRLKDVLALLLTDTLIFLQEKDQKYTFATVDQKPPVIALQKLIVREVANEERGMFLISASAAGPEMYEVHASSKEERNTWMRLIREAVESCPEEEEEYTSESEEEKRVAEARSQKIQKLQENLLSQDQQICASLEEKLQIYAELSAVCARMDASLVEPRLLVQPHYEEPPQAAALLAVALQEAENLKAALSSKACSPSSHSSDSDTDSTSPASAATLLDPPSEPEASPGDPEAGEGSWTEAVAPHSPLSQRTDVNNIDVKVARSVQTLTQLLYSLQAAVAIQDSCYEVQRCLLQETGRPSPRAQRPHLPSVRGNTLQEQEKQRNLEKRKEEAVAAQRLQDRLRLERERWEKECQARESRQEEQEGRLDERERQCHLEAERLRREREELDEQLEEYQQSLERLREGQRSVEREREQLENQQELLQNWRHGRQRSLPAVIPHMLIPLDGQQDSAPSQSRDNAGNGSVFVNEAAFAGSSLNNRRVHHKGTDASTHNCLNTLLARSSSRQLGLAKTPHNTHADPQGWMMGRGFLYSPAGTLVELEHSASDHRSRGYIGEAWPSAASVAEPYLLPAHPGDPQLDLGTLVSLETDSGGEEGREETIVYL